MAKLNFGGVEEEVVTRDEFPLEKARQVLKDEVVAVLRLRRAGSGSGAEHARQRHTGDCWAKTQQCHLG